MEDWKISLIFSRNKCPSDAKAGKDEEDALKIAD